MVMSNELTLFLKGEASGLIKTLAQTNDHLDTLAGGMAKAGAPIKDLENQTDLLRAAFQGLIQDAWETSQGINDLALRGEFLGHTMKQISGGVKTVESAQKQLNAETHAGIVINKEKITQDAINAVGLKTTAYNVGRMILSLQKSTIEGTKSKMSWDKHFQTLAQNSKQFKELGADITEITQIRRLLTAAVNGYLESQDRLADNAMEHRIQLEEEKVALQEYRDEFEHIGGAINAFKVELSGLTNEVLKQEHSVESLDAKIAGLTGQYLQMRGMTAENIVQQEKQNRQLEETRREISATTKERDLANKKEEMAAFLLTDTGKELAHYDSQLKQLLLTRSKDNLLQDSQKEKLEQIAKNLQRTVGAMKFTDDAHERRIMLLIKEMGVLDRMNTQYAQSVALENKWAVGLDRAAQKIGNYTKGTGRMNAAISNGSFAIQDFVTVLQGGGGLERAILSTTNNIGMMASLLKPGITGAVIGTAVAIGSAMIPVLRDLFDDTEEVNMALRENNDQMDENTEGTLAWARALEEAHASIGLLNEAILAGKEEEHNEKIDAGEKGIKKYKNAYMNLLAAQAAVAASRQDEVGQLDDLERQQKNFTETTTTDILALYDIMTLGLRVSFWQSFLGTPQQMDEQVAANKRVATSIGTGITALMGDVWEAASKFKWIDAWGSTAAEMQEQLDIQISALKGNKIINDQKAREDKEAADEAREQQRQMDQLAKEEKEQAFQDDIDAFTKTSHELAVIALKRERDQLDIANMGNKNKEGWLDRSIAIQESYEKKLQDLNDKELKRQNSKAVSDEKDLKKLKDNLKVGVKSEREAAIAKIDLWVEEQHRLLELAITRKQVTDEEVANIKREIAARQKGKVEKVDEKLDADRAKRKMDIHDEINDILDSEHQRQVRALQDQKDNLAARAREEKIGGDRLIAAMKAIQDKIDALNKKEKDKKKPAGQPDTFEERLDKINAQRAATGQAPIHAGSRQGRAIQRQVNQEQEDFSARQREAGKGMGGRIKKWSRYFESQGGMGRIPPGMFGAGMKRGGQRRFEGMQGQFGDTPGGARGQAVVGAGAVAAGGEGTGLADMIPLLGLNQQTNQMNNQMLQTIIDEIDRLKANAMKDQQDQRKIKKSLRATRRAGRN